MTSLKRYIVLRVEFPEGIGDHEALKLGDQFVEFGNALGDTYIVEEGIAEAPESA